MAGCRLLFVVELEPESSTQEARWDIRLGRPVKDGKDGGRILALNDEPAAVLTWLDRLCAAGRQRAALVVIARSDPGLGTLHVLETEEDSPGGIPDGGRSLGRVRGTVEEIADALAHWLGEERNADRKQQAPARRRIAIA